MMNARPLYTIMAMMLMIFSSQAFTMNTPSSGVITTKTTSSSMLQMSSSSSSETKQTISTLTKDTTWRLRFALNSVPTRNGRKVGELFVVDVQFIEDEGFEPPQGSIVQVQKKTNDDDDEISSLNVEYLKILNGRWKLSEDPEDRKDGLWVWGLFKEPLYPYLLLQLETDEYNLPNSDPADAVQPLALYAQINHSRDKDSGNVELGTSVLNLREVELMKADPFGASMVEIFEDVNVGQLTLRPVSD
jgi:hypothetical protein